MEDLMIKVDNVKKQYRLGAIGGGTLQGDIQSWWARKQGKEDPNSKIGSKIYAKNEKFMALDGVSFEVKKGERVGIIGHNGAGKSTLLKLLSRVTAPTSGEIGLNGRVTSMLEVGTGFHGELTGRENIYMNGAILGMNKAEIDAKMEDIIEFSECRQFIDTPVKRYSSGMYVKLAFSVAAHLDSEIMIMDEVLAVGDVAFQNKCINKMKEVAESGRTILYVSHNMATIRNFCSRCVVMSHGQIIYDGDVETAISYYTFSNVDMNTIYDIRNVERLDRLSGLLHLNKVELLNSNDGVYTMGDQLKFKLCWDSKEKFSDMQMRIGIFTYDQRAVGISFTEKFESHIGDNVLDVILDTSQLVPGRYRLEIIMIQIADNGYLLKHDRVDADVIIFEIVMSEEKPMYIAANQSWGNFELASTIELGC